MINKNEIGIIQLNKNAINDIADIAVKEIDSIYPVKKGAGFANSVFNDDELEVTISLKIAIGADLLKISENIQKKVNELILENTGIDCKKIIIDIQGFVS